jgi:hypothetical protein
VRAAAGRLCRYVLTRAASADPAGEFLAFFGKNVAAPELAGQIGGHMKHWTPQ